MDPLRILTTELFALLRCCAIIVTVLVLMMTLVELLHHRGTILRLSGKAAPLLARLGFSRDAGIPLISGTLLGLTYGSGAIIGTSNGALTRKDLYLLGVFFTFCHGMIEDPLIFVPAGANWFILVGTRLALTVLGTMTASRVYDATHDRE